MYSAKLKKGERVLEFIEESWEGEQTFYQKISKKDIKKEKCIQKREYHQRKSSPMGNNPIAEKGNLTRIIVSYSSTGYF